MNDDLRIPFKLIKNKNKNVMKFSQKPIYNGEYDLII